MKLSHFFPSATVLIITQNLPDEYFLSKFSICFFFGV
jgi:hypothetical protein